MKLSKIISSFNLISHKLSFDKHKSIRTSIIDSLKNNHNDLYDYGEGFFYQSVPKINLKGLRNTQKRIDKLNLNKYLENKNFLDIGTNGGAIPLSLNNNFKNGVGIDYNSSLINVAKIIQNYLEIKNLEFICGDFLKYEFNKKFEVILSLANHSTFDKGLNDINQYFQKLNSLIDQNGILIIESHNPLYEKNETFMEIINQLKDKYEIIDNGIYKFGNFYDQNRTYFILKKK